MRNSWMGAALLAVLCSVQPALAQAPAPASPQSPLTVTVSSKPLPTGEVLDVPPLSPGDDVTIACDAIERVADPSDVRVVLTIAAIPGDSSPGYKKILALNEKVTASSVHLKVPNAPDLANHTVDLSVYVVNGPQHTDCDGGNIASCRRP
ncbi:MAG: hypothetical protein WDM89_04420 [Rhizomicrobium sp.]